MASFPPPFPLKPPGMPNSPPGPSKQRVALALAVSLLLTTALPLPAEDGVIDLGALPDYVNQPIPRYIFDDNTPWGPEPYAYFNPTTNTGATLGRLLFYDKRLSRNDTVSC